MKGLFLDLDGTLADSVGALRGVYMAFLAEFRIAGNEAEFQALNGPPIPRIVEILKATYGLEPPAGQLLELYRALLAGAHGATLPAEGASALLVRARERGWRVAVVTSGGHAATRAWLAANGLSALIDEVVGGDDVGRGKPDPEPYLRALALTGCRRDVSLAVEDSPQGAAAALAAGLPTLMIAPRAPDEVAASPLFRGVLGRLAEVAERV